MNIHLWILKLQLRTSPSLFIYNVYVKDKVSEYILDLNCYSSISPQLQSKTNYKGTTPIKHDVKSISGQNNVLI